MSKLTYLGHSAVILEMKNLSIGIDPWIETNPACPEKSKKLDKLDLIVLTHGHSDHASEAPRLAKRHGSYIAATWELAMIMIAEGVPESHVIPMNRGGTTNWNGINISLTTAFHSSSYDTASGPVYAGEACGVVISDGAKTVYHAGDTALFSDMKLIGETYKPQIALLPIGDRFTMGPKEAAKAAALVGAKINIPVHYKTFGLLTGTAEEFQSACESNEQQTKILAAGESYDF